MRHLVAIVFCLFMTTIVSAEGTREVAPNPQIFINGTPTNDIAAMYISEPRYNNFATYGNPNATSRLHIHIKDPSAECIYLGLSAGTLNTTGQNAPNVEYEYRIVDPAGNIVFGPQIMDPTNAQINDWIQGFTGPAPLYGANGYNPEVVSSNDLTSQGWSGAGDYYIEFQAVGGGPFLINYWDFTVVDCSAAPTEKKGRLWSNNWALFAINDYGFPERPFNGAFYVCAPDPSNPGSSFITKVDFAGSGFKPAAFNVAFNSFGAQNTGNIIEDRKSRENINFTNPEYEIFLNDPIDLCETADIGTIALEGISRCDMTDFCIKLTSSKEGQIDILLDFDGPDGVFTPGTADRIITTSVGANQVGRSICLDWDGKDGLGQPMAEDASTEIPLVVSYAQGIYHFPIYDAELLETGYQITAVRPTGSTPQLYYDDTEITTASGTGEPNIQLNGCALPCHGWTTYVDAGTPGFGNLNTINSWWFSSQIFTEAVFNLPGYYTCLADGPEQLCPGEEGEVSYTLTLFPPNANSLQVISSEWTGPGISGAANGDTIDVNAAGMYSVLVKYLNETGDTCETECVTEIEQGQQTTVIIDTLIVKGDSVVFNNEVYTDGGRYTQKITSTTGCDSLLIINVRLAQTTIYYDFNDCRSFKSDSTHADYTEFEVKYPDPLSCANISADFLRRELPFENPHSCTPGVNNTPAMCVGSLDTCAYDAGTTKSIIFEVEIEPNADTAILVTELAFYERAPEMFDWLNGPSGPNNYPTLYGVRILKNGIEVFREIDIATSFNWTKEIFPLSEIPEMLIEDPATLRFELLGYCTQQDTIEVNAWDIDELTVAMACAPKKSTAPLVVGKIQMSNTAGLSDLEIRLSSTESFNQYESTFSDENGAYVFNPISTSNEMYLDVVDPQNYEQGLSMRDAILLYRHVLGRPFLTVVGPNIAADIDQNNITNIRDIKYLRDLILGRTATLPNGAWAFGEIKIDPDEDQAFLDKNLNILFNNSPQVAKDITAIKLGDLDESYDPGLISNGTRSEQSININSEDKFVTAGQTIAQTFSFSSEDIQGYQLFINIEGASIEAVTSSETDFNESYYHLDERNLSIVWNKATSNPTTEITLHMTFRSSGLISNLISFNNKKQSEIYTNQELHVWSPQFIWGETEDFQEDEVVIFPNPSADGTFYIQGISDWRNVRVIDLSGKTINVSLKSNNQIQLNKKGLYLLQIVSDGTLSSYKLLFL